MFCKECGHEMPDGVMFCPECGAKQDGNAAQTNASGTQAAGAVPVGQGPQRQGEAPKKQIQIDKKWMAPIAVVAGVVVVAGIVSMTMKPTIKLDKYMEVSAEGYNTVGKATLSFDTEKFEKDYEKKLEKALKKGKNKKNKNAYQASAYLPDYFGDYDPTSEAANLLSNAVSGELDKTSSLSNGDVITYQWSCDDDYVLNKYGFKLKYSDIQYTISGLEEAETFDPFEGLEVTFEGIETEGRATLNGQPTAREAQDLNYDFDKSSDLSNGDTVTVSVSTYNGDVIDYCIDKYDKIPSPMEKTFTVAGLQHYASGAGDISDEARKSMENRGQEIYYSSMKTWSNEEKLEGFTYLGNYLLKRKEGSSGTYKNVYYAVYKATIHDTYSNSTEIYDKPVDIYWYIRFYDLTADENGNTTVDLMDYDVPGTQVQVDSGVGYWFSTRSWYYDGFQNLDELNDEVVTYNLDNYDCVEKNFSGSSDSAGSESSEVASEERGDTAETEAAEVETSAATGGEDGQIFPDSSSQIIDTARIKALSDADLKYAINEIYARHGYIFKGEDLKNYYKQFSWYHESVPASQFTTSMFNSTEHANVDAMQAERDSRK